MTMVPVKTNLANTLKEHDTHLSSMEVYVFGNVKTWLENVEEDTESFALRLENVEGEVKTTNEAIFSLREETTQKIAGVNFRIDEVDTKATQDNEIIRNKLDNTTSQLNELTDELNVLSFAVEEVKYDVGLLTFKMEGYDEHKLFVNSQLKSLDKSIKNVPKLQLGDNTE